ncbi:MAG: hypothetical protein RLZZ455_276 [Candidatus Parcubacteria bacterium]|jgi:hypothetical protein
MSKSTSMRRYRFGAIDKNKCLELTEKGECGLKAQLALLK